MLEDVHSHRVGIDFGVGVIGGRDIFKERPPFVGLSGYSFIQAVTSFEAWHKPSYCRVQGDEIRKRAERAGIVGGVGSHESFSVLRLFGHFAGGSVHAERPR